MTLEILATVTNILASMAVVASLLFVGIQLKQSSRAAQMTAAQMSTQLYAENLGRVATNADLADLLSGTRSREELSPAELLRIRNFISASFRHFEVIHTHRRYGLHEEEMWLGAEMRLRQSLMNPAIREWWLETHQMYARPFAELVADIILEIQAAEGEIANMREAAAKPEKV